MTATATESVEIGALRRYDTDLDKLFEAVRIAELLGLTIEVVHSYEPIPVPPVSEGEYDKKRREDNAAQITFYAITEPK